MESQRMGDTLGVVNTDAFNVNENTADAVTNVW
jgi:hypothetical protein